MTSLISSANSILRTLENAGKTAYFVGGFLRDAYIKNDGILCDSSEISDTDIDIASDARPEEIIEIFAPFTVATGLRYGTVTILKDGHSFEHTTFRKDLEYSEGSRKPVISYSKTIEEDLSRRDFTMNAMAVDLRGRLVDPFGGKADIENKLIRSVGKPDERFGEDPLRKLRAIRFVSKTGFKLDEKIVESIKRNPALTGVSPERMNRELQGILSGAHVYEALSYLRDLNLLGKFIPDLAGCVGFLQHNPYHDFDVYEHIIRTVSAAKNDLTIRLAALFHDVGKPLCFTVDDKGCGHFYGHSRLSAEIAFRELKALRFPNKLIEDVSVLIDNHSDLPRIDEKAVRRWISKVGAKNADAIIELEIADNLGKKLKDNDISFYCKLREMLREVQTKDAVFKRKDLKIDGNRLIAELEITEAERYILGDIFDYLLECCLDSPEMNEEEALIRLAEKRYGELNPRHLRGSQ